MLELQCHDLLGVQCRAFMNFLWVSTIFKRNGHTQQTICTVGEQKHLCTLFCSCSDSCRTTMKLALTVKIHWWKQWRSNWCDRGHNICDRGSKESNSKTFFISLSLSQEMPQLRSLWLQGNSLPSAELQKILEKRPPLEVEDSTAQKTKMPHFVETWHFGRRWRHARLHCKRVHFRNDRFLSCALLRSQDQADSIVPSTLPVPDLSLLADASCFEKGQISNLGGFLFERLVSSLVEGLLSFQKLLARLEAPTALQTGARGWLWKNISIIVDHMRWALVARPVTVLAVNRECSWVFVFFCADTHLARLI